MKPAVRLAEDVARRSRQLPLEASKLIERILQPRGDLITLRDGQTLTKATWQTTQVWSSFQLKPSLAAPHPGNSAAPGGRSFRATNCDRTQPAPVAEVGLNRGRLSNNLRQGHPDPWRGNDPYPPPSRALMEGTSQTPDYVSGSSDACSPPGGCYVRRIFMEHPTEIAPVSLASPCGSQHRANPPFRVAPSRRLWGLAALAIGALLPVSAGDSAQLGHAWNRNMVSAERGLPDGFDPQSGRNVKWTARLGTETHSTPIVAGGRILVGTNNGEPREANHQGDRGVLMCFAESDGRFLWQLVVPKRVEDVYYDWPNSGISSTPSVEGDRAYVVDNRGVVLCLDLGGLADGNQGPFVDEGIYLAPQPTNAVRVLPPGFDSAGRRPAGPPEANQVATGPLDADIVWLFDLTSGAGIWSHDAAHSSVLIHGPHLYLNTGTGVDNTHRRIRRPDAPSLVVLDKATGRLLAREEEGIAPNIFHSTWAPPSLATVDGRELILFAAGDGFVYAFEPLATDRAPAEVQRLKKVWRYDFDPAAPKAEVHRFHLNKTTGPSNFYGAPVGVDGRMYVAGGGDLWWGKNGAWLHSVDLALGGERPAPALRWSYPLVRHTFSTPAVSDGLVYVTDCSQNLHCVDALTGQSVWIHELQGETWASPFVADGKVFVGTRRGVYHIMAAGREKRMLAEIQLGQPISATGVAANGVLYVATMSHLYAVANAPAASAQSSGSR